jgi:hypothetical protein
MNKKVELKCPQCGKINVASTQEEVFMVNTGERFCCSKKPYDWDAKAKCYDCGWEGLFSELYNYSLWD